MAAEGGGALKKHKVWSKYTKKNPKHKAHKACCKNLKSGNHPLVKALENCGYQDVVIFHSPTEASQAGSYRPAFLDQLTIGDEVFNVVVKDEAGFLLPPDNENCLSGCSDKATLKKMREVVQDDEARKAYNTCPFGGYGWKVATSGLRGETGGYVIATTVKQDSLVKDGYFQLYDDAQGADYWQKYVDGVADANDYSYKPSDVFDVEVGGEYTIMSDKAKFDALGVSSHSPFTTQEAWDQMCHDLLGWDCKVTGHNDAGDGWAGYNVDVEVTHNDGTKVTGVIPMRALRKDQPGKTALMLGEVGQFVFKAEMALHETKTHKERASANMINPLVAEWVSIIGNYAGDELGYGEFLDYEEEDNAALWNNWNPLIQAYLQEQIDNDVDYADLGFSAE